MLRSFMILFVIALVSPDIVAVGDDAIPKPFAQQLKRMVGSWVFTGQEEGREFSGEEKIRLVNNKTALLQEGFFNLDDGKKEHYVILSGWDSEKKKMLVSGFTSEGLAWSGEWKSVKNGALIGVASGKQAEFIVKDGTMKYEEAGGKWISKFERTGDGK